MKKMSEATERTKTGGAIQRTFPKTNDIRSRTTPSFLPKAKPDYGIKRHLSGANVPLQAGHMAKPSHADLFHGDGNDLVAYAQSLHYIGRNLIIEKEIRRILVDGFLLWPAFFPAP
jgi:hypothetical protein